MKFIFSWENALIGGRPVCFVRSDKNEEMTNICCLLMDDGGLGLVEAKAWIEIGIKYIHSVMNGSYIQMNWDREAWGSFIKKDITTIYSLYDQDVKEKIITENFLDIMVNWLMFIKNSNIPELEIDI